ncbi:adhesion G-protein coupled receptor G5-like [Colossoma macropomum]|uniref:adhesion G-protein coupled receptor G5-like n=1 Tax=Colossoma macropomum TaxID=42526 RepID=UPI001864BFDB|nr:adhesion G-protein coupled receptor G5-like [Colossoma macropomum]
MRTRKYKLAFIALGWGFPALVVIVIAAFGNYTYLTNVQMCWNRNIYIHYIVNVGYYALVFIFTLIIFIMIVRKITQARFMKNNAVKAASKKIAAIFSLTVLLGLTWGVAFFSYGAMAIASYYIFSILNSFQGFFLFLYYYYFRNDDLELNQSASSTALSLQKPTNVSSTMTSEPETETEYN